MIRGQTVTLYEQTQTGTDDFNRPIYTETPVTVANVLIGEPSTDEVTTATDLYGKKILFMLGIPKGDTHDWQDKKVSWTMPNGSAMICQTFGFPIFGVGILLGAVWAESAWGRFWGWDPKEVWTFVIWTVYAAYLHARATKNTSRQDNYTTDPNFSFTQPGKWSGYTRGHLLGSAERLVSRKANDQVFYYSNIAPQHSTYFNTGGGAWNTLEEWVDKQWVGAADTTYQVIGCYWDPAESQKQVSGTTIPTHYYKVLLRTKNHKNKWVVECSKDELQCIAVMVEHRTYEKSEVPKPADYEKKGMFLSVKEMEELTGLTFFGNVPNAPKESYNVSDWTF